MEFEIRLATNEDAEGIYETHVASIQNVQHPDYSSAQITTWKERQNAEHYIKFIENGCIYVAVSLNEIVGFVHLEEIDTNEKHFKIKALFVHPTFSGKGAGTKLYRHVEQVAEQKGCKLMTVESSLSAEGFYKSNGFVSEEVVGHTDSYTDSNTCSSCPMTCRKMLKKF
eukprot:Seg3397.4 transcript_id=Seg3397.4/GoldUCD/mRNA.D3Y31 product="hypothetical protein" protein_id=Seg3397.4/GoldUCD/D3Y31